MGNTDSDTIQHSTTNAICELCSSSHHFITYILSTGIISHTRYPYSIGGNSPERVYIQLYISGPFPSRYAACNCSKQSLSTVGKRQIVTLAMPPLIVQDCSVEGDTRKYEIALVDGGHDCFTDRHYPMVNIITSVTSHIDRHGLPAKRASPLCRLIGARVTYNELEQLDYVEEVLPLYPSHGTTFPLGSDVGMLDPAYKQLFQLDQGKY
jgi:hypothetical protein